MFENDPWGFKAFEYLKRLRAEKVRFWIDHDGCLHFTSKADKDKADKIKEEVSNGGI